MPTSVPSVGRNNVVLIRDAISGIPIRIKRCYTSGRPPPPLRDGEMAVNIVDKVLWVGTVGQGNVELLGDASIEDAGEDGVYGRSDGQWVQQPVVDTNPPATPFPNQKWIDASDFKTFIRYQGVWVELPVGLAGPIGPIGPRGIPGPQGDPGSMGVIATGPEPQNPTVGTPWIDGGVLKYWDGDWIPISGGAPPPEWNLFSATPTSSGTISATGGFRFSSSVAGSVISQRVYVDTTQTRLLAIWDTSNGSKIAEEPVTGNGWLVATYNTSVPIIPNRNYWATWYSAASIPAPPFYTATVALPVTSGPLTVDQYGFITNQNAMPNTTYPDWLGNDIVFREGA